MSIDVNMSINKMSIHVYMSINKMSKHVNMHSSRPQGWSNHQSQLCGW